ncbi:transposase [Streptomyces sp. NBC_01221]|uniref:hypothetical protein n=1 Tax=Streptomyces sp. NBC_01221 TaxID=2903782 RepID=UPI00224FCE3D|nr:hypothetical protein [Streptomyces sp. NBC_01221]MCX4792368.1 transposase [Streptomyces sp. NBC_01221]
MPTSPSVRGSKRWAMRGSAAGPGGLRGDAVDGERIDEWTASPSVARYRPTLLADPKWADKLTDADRRALSRLFWTHVNPYGRFELDMNSRLDLELAAAVTVPGPRSPQSEASATR